MALHMHENLCMVLIYLCKSNLNLPMCSSFFSALSLVASFSLSLYCHSHSLAALCWFFCLFVFKEANFVVQPEIKHVLVNLKAGFHSSYFADEKSIIELVYLYKLYQHEIYPIFIFCRKHFWPVGKLTWLDKNTFYGVVEAGLKDDFVMYYFLQGPRIVKINSCFCPMVLSTCHNGELLIFRPHSPLCLKKIRTTTTTAFFISNTVVPNLYGHSSAFDP